MHTIDCTSWLLNKLFLSHSRHTTKESTRQQQQEETDEEEPAAEGLLRLREDDHHHIDHNEESLHSFRFSSSNTFSIREELLQKKKRLHGTLPGHYATSELLVNKANTRNKTKTVSSPIISSKHHFRKSTQLLESPKRSISNGSSQSTNTTKSVSTPPTTEDEDDYEEEEEDTYVPHLHNRLKQQNQGILTTYDDWRIILTNSIAQDVLVSHLHHKMNEEQKLILVGKSVMDLIEPSYQNRLKSIIVKRRNELKHRDAEHNGAGMVLVCGNVVMCTLKKKRKKQGLMLSMYRYPLSNWTVQNHPLRSGSRKRSMNQAILYLYGYLRKCMKVPSH